MGVRKPLVTGVAASKGQATGTVILLDDLMSRQTSPETPLVVVGEMIPPDIQRFSNNVRAIVTDEGGILCHGATLAREMQIPAVVGTENASTLLKPGALVMVDGEKGEVYEA
jgi:pyruvate,water dikinase